MLYSKSIKGEGTGGYPILAGGATVLCVAPPTNWWCHCALVWHHRQTGGATVCTLCGTTDKLVVPLCVLCVAPPTNWWCHCVYFVWHHRQTGGATVCTLCG